MTARLLVGCLSVLLPLHMGLTAGRAAQAQQVEVAGVRLRFVNYQGPATFSAKSLDKRSLHIDVDPRSERLTIEVALPPAWSADQTQVRATALGKAAIPTISVAEGKALRFHALPITTEYVIEKAM